MAARDAEALIVGGDDGVALRQRLFQDGAQTSATPTVPWAQAISGQPPAGASPLGRKSEPETATGVLPSRPSVEE
jgi:hypothetical protein